MALSPDDCAAARWANGSMSWRDSDPPSAGAGRTREGEEAARGGQTLAVIPALAALLDEGIACGEGGLDVAAAVRVPG